MRKLSEILLVDDDEIANHLHKLLIEDLDLAEHVEVASDGEEAFDIIEQRYHAHHFANDILLLLDINMPGMDAFEFLEVFRQKFKDSADHLHIALLSSSSNWRDVEKAKRFNIRNYLSKPLTEDKLIKLIEEINITV